MTFRSWIPLALQLVLPLALLLWLAFGRPRDLLAWLVRVVLVTCYIVLISAAGLWLALPGYGPIVYGFALLLAIVHSLPQGNMSLLPRRNLLDDRLAHPH